MTIELNDDTVVTTPLGPNSRLFGATGSTAQEPTSFGREAILNYIITALATIATTGSATDINGGTLPIGTLPVNLQNIANILAPERGDILYFNGTAWVSLNPGTAGNVLTTYGDGADPGWGPPGGLIIGDNVQAWDADLDTLAGLSKAAGNIIIGNGSSWTVEGGATIVRSDETATLTAGYSATPYNAGTFSSGTFTPSAANGGFQYATNDGAHTLAPPVDATVITIEYTNGASAGAITTSGFDFVLGDTPALTNGVRYLAHVMTHLNVSQLTWVTASSA